MTARKVGRALAQGAGLGAGLLAAPAVAQEFDQLGRGLEMKGHEALMQVVEEAGGTPAAFTTDGCSGGLSAAWETLAGYWPEFAEIHLENPPFEHCCVTHDRAYHGIGGALDAEASYQNRLAADRALRVCVAEEGTARRQDIAAQYKASPEQVDQAYALLSGAMYYAVRFGGGPCSGLPWRWGYGFDDCHDRIPGVFRGAASQ